MICLLLLLAGCQSLTRVVVETTWSRDYKIRHADCLYHILLQLNEECIEFARIYANFSVRLETRRIGRVKLFHALSSCQPYNLGSIYLPSEMHHRRSHKDLWIITKDNHSSYKYRKSAVWVNCKLNDQATSIKRFVDLVSYWRICWKDLRMIFSLMFAWYAVISKVWCFIVIIVSVFHISFRV